MVPSPYVSITRLSNSHLMEALQALLTREHGLNAELIATLSEVDERQLYLARACSSMFVFCRDQLHMAEAVAYKRIRVARAVRRFPLVLDKLARGEVHLTAAAMLAPVLTPENHEELLARATHKSKQQVAELLAERFPKPDVATRVCKLPERQAAETTPRAPIGGSGHSDSAQCGRTDASSSTTGASSSASPAVSPLSRERYKVQFTASRALRDKLEEARALMRHQVPTGDIPTIVERALDLLLADVKQRRFGIPRKKKQGCVSRTAGGQDAGERAAGERTAGERTAVERKKNENAVRERATGERKNNEKGPCERVAGDRRNEKAVCGRAPGERKNNERAAGNKRTRHIPAEVKREVVERDGLRCGFVDAEGNRCQETGFLELHHDGTAFARGGEHVASNLKVYCRAHNAWAAALEFGEATMERRRKTRVESKSKRKGEASTSADPTRNQEGASECPSSTTRKKERASECPPSAARKKEGASATSREEVNDGGTIAGDQPEGTVIRGTDGVRSILDLDPGTTLRYAPETGRGRNRWVVVRRS